MSKEIELTRRKVLGSAAVVGAASAGAGAGTFAYFSDTENTNNNTITAGQVSIGSVTGADFSVSDFAPGQTESQSITVSEESGNLADSEVEFDISITVPDNDLADYLYATVSWDGNDLGSGPESLSNYDGDYVNQSLPGTGGSDLTFDLEFRADDDASGTGIDDNNLQNESFNIEVEFLLRQSGASDISA